MYLCVRGLRGLTVLTFLALVFAPPVSANTYNTSSSFGSNLGSLNYTVTWVSERCIASNGLSVVYTLWDYYKFVYVSNQGASQPING